MCKNVIKTIDTNVILMGKTVLRKQYTHTHVHTATERRAKLILIIFLKAHSMLMAAKFNWLHVAFYHCWQRQRRQQQRTMKTATNE